MKRYIKMFSVIICLLFWSFVANAGTTGKIVGSVKDKNSGDPLIGANVVLEGTNFGAATDIDGYFVIINIPPGTYDLTVYYVGYAQVTIKNISVNVDRTTSQEISMSPAAVEGETVTVEATRPIVEMDRTHSSSVVSSKTVELLPVTELEEIIQLQSGVVSSGGQLHFRGGRAREVSYVIDGIPVNNTFDQDGGSLVEIDNNMVSELEVISGTFNAEYGQAQSGVVNVVTKRPTSDFHFKLEGYAGDWVSNKDNVFLGVKDVDPSAERNIQASISGPIIGNKLGFFVTGRFRQFQSLQWAERRFNAYDGWRIAAYREWLGNNGNNNSGSIISIPDTLVTGDLLQGPMQTGDYFSLQAKLNYAITPKLSLTYTGFGSYQETRGLTNTNLTFAPDFRATNQDLRYSQFLRLQHFPTENFFYTIAATYQRDTGDNFFRKDNKIARFPGDEGIVLAPFNATTANAFGRQFSLGGTSGLYTGAPGRNYVDQYQLQGDFNWQMDKYNFIKAGISYTRHYYDVYRRGFDTVTDWDNNPYAPTTLVDPTDLTFEEYWNAQVLFWRNWESIYGKERIREVGRDEVALYSDYQNEPVEYAFYLQDKLELGSDIIINAGMRYDVFDPNERVPKNYRTEAELVGDVSNLIGASIKKQVSPRMGISFPISSKGAFHASYGHFFQMPAHQRMFNAPLVSISPIDLEGRRLGNADLEPERTIAYEIGLQQAITEGIGVAVTAYYKDFKNLLGIEQVKTNDQVTYTRYVNRDYGVSKGITLDITKRSGKINGGINYSLSFANGSNSDPTEIFLISTTTNSNTEDETFADRQIAPLDWDQRQTVNGFINIVEPNNWSIGITGFVDSGTPFTPDTRGFLEQFGLSDRENRNLGKKPFRWTIDLKAKKNLNLSGVKGKLFLKVDNLFDHLNQENVFVFTGRADQNARLPEQQEPFERQINAEGLITTAEADLNPNFFSEPRKVQIGFEITL